MSGPRDVMKMVSVHMTADLSAWARDDDVLIRWLINPDFGGSFSGVLVPMGPDSWGPRSEEWVFHMQYATDDLAGMQRDKILERMRATLGIPDFAPMVHKISTWTMEGVIADKFRVGPVFLAGDAAHRHPPTGGLGLNSAVHDVHNLCWKLAAVLDGRAGDGLLDSYETERRPVDQANIDNALANAANHFTIDAALNLSADNTPEQNWAQLRPLWENCPESKATATCAQSSHRLPDNRIPASQRRIRLCLSFRMPSLMTAPAPVPADEVRLYSPCTRPGHPVPHAWVEREGAAYRCATWSTEAVSSCSQARRGGVGGGRHTRSPPITAFRLWQARWECSAATTSTCARHGLGTARSGRPALCWFGPTAISHFDRSTWRTTRRLN